MKETILFSDKLTYQIETSRGICFDDDMHNFDYWKFIKMLKLSGFDLYSRSPIIEYLKPFESKKDDDVEFSTDWATLTDISPFKPRITLKDDASKSEIRNSAIYKHVHGHLSSYKSRKLFIREDNHKSIILGRACRGIGFPSVRNSYVLKIDLDNHNYDLLDDSKRKERMEYLEEIIRNLIHDLGVQPVYVARSLSHGYHIYFRVSDPKYSKEIYKRYFCKTYGYESSDIEISNTTKGFRIPGHWTYTMGTWDEELGYIPDDNRTGYIDRFLDCFYDEDYISKCYNFQLWLMGVSHEEYVEIMADTEDSEHDELSDPALGNETTIASAKGAETKSDKKHVKSYYNKKTVPFQRKAKSGITINTDRISKEFPIAAGIRNYNLYAIGCRLAHTSFETFVETVKKANDLTSKDWLKKTEEEQMKELLRVWKNVQSRRTCTSKPTDNSSFISNVYLVSRSYKEQYNNPLIISHLLDICGLRSPYPAVTEKRMKAMTTLLIELEGYLHYQGKNKRKLSDDYAFRTDLCRGFIVSRAWCEALQKHYKIPFKVYLAVLKIRHYMASNAEIWQPIGTRDGRYYQHFGITYCTQFGEGAYINRNACALMSFLIIFIKRLYAARQDASIPQRDSSTYMRSDFVAKAGSELPEFMIRPPG